MNDAQVRDGDSEEEPSSTPDVAEVWGTLRTNGAVPDDLQLRDFLWADNCAVSIETMSDEAVVQRVTDHHDNDGSFAVNPQSVARTTREALGASMFYAVSRAPRMMLLR